MIDCRAIGDMILAARRLKVIDQDECSKTNKKDEAKGKADTERQKVGAGMRPHERNKLKAAISMRPPEKMPTMPKRFMVVARQDDKTA